MLGNALARLHRLDAREAGEAVPRPPCWWTSARSGSAPPMGQLQRAAVSHRFRHLARGRPDGGPPLVASAFGSTPTQVSSYVPLAGKAIGAVRL
jgi:hypothetical protein